MGKKELLEKETKLKELESAVVSNFSINNGSLFRAAETLLAIEKGELFKVVKNDGKMAYRTFKAYLDHFELDSTHRKLLEKLITFHEFLIDNKLESVVPLLSSTSDEFWTLFMKIKPECWIKIVKSFRKRNTQVTTEEVEAFIKLDPTCKVGYSAARKLPTPVQNIIGNAKKLSDESLAELILRGTDEEGFERLYTLMRKAKESMDGVSIVAVDNKLIDEDNTFAVIQTDGEAKAAKYVRKKIDRNSLFGTVIGFLIAGYIIGRLIEYGIHFMMMQ